MADAFLRIVITVRDKSAWNRTKISLIQTNKLKNLLFQHIWVANEVSAFSINRYFPQNCYIKNLFAYKIAYLAMYQPVCVYVRLSVCVILWVNAMYISTEKRDGMKNQPFTIGVLLQTFCGRYSQKKVLRFARYHRQSSENMRHLRDFDNIDYWSVFEWSLRCRRHTNIDDE